MLTDRLRQDMMRFKKQCEKFITENELVVADEVAKDLWNDNRLSRSQLIWIAIKIILTE